MEYLWKPCVVDVPSNHEITLKIYDIVFNKLECKGKLKSYNQIFQDQIKENIVEESECHSSEFVKLLAASSSSV